MNNLIKSLQERLAGQQYFIANGGQKSYDLCADGGYNEAVKNEIEFLRDILNKCPNCGETDIWFDRTINLNLDGTEDGMHTRCAKCGEILD